MTCDLATPLFCPALEVAEELKRKCIDVEVIVIIDAVGAGNNELPTNVKRGLNIYVKGGTKYFGFFQLGGNQIKGAQNQALAGTNHEQIDNDPRTQQFAADALTGRMDVQANPSYKSAEK